VHDKIFDRVFLGADYARQVLKNRARSARQFRGQARSRDEALDRIEQVAGPQGRATLAKVLDQIGKAEAKFLAENGNGE
jgi:hypothetical protein